MKSQIVCNSQNEVDVMNVRNMIFMLRDRHVMLDRDLAVLYDVSTKRLNEAVKRNIERFPERFRFQLSKEEMAELVANCDRFKSLKHSPFLAYAFTEQGVAMLSSVLNSATAVAVSIGIMDAFVQMRHFIRNNFDVFNEISRLKQHQILTDSRVEELFDLMDRYKIDNKQGIFFQGQIFDAYAKFESFISEAKESIVLIDNYVDVTILERLTRKGVSASVTIYTHPSSKLSKTDIQAFNSQYPHLEVKYTAKTHDRFMIIDSSTLYHIGASLKDLGKKCFAFEVLDSSFIAPILANLS